jgi:hypothetical protein
MSMSDVEPQGYIVEFRVVGKSVKVTALDPVSLLEVSIIGSPLMPRKLLSRHAVRKLESMMKKRGSQ